jgi:hypothetical protein
MRQAIRKEIGPEIGPATVKVIVTSFGQMIVTAIVTAIGQAGSAKPAVQAGPPSQAKCSSNSMQHHQ